LNWYDWHTITDRLEGRSQALTRGLPYKVTLDPSIITAACNISAKQIRLNPVAFDHKIRTRDDKLRSRTNYLITRALLGHEVLHALYSDPNALPDEQIHRSVTNLLEDARIEGIGMDESMVNRQLFKFLSTICRQDQAVFDDFSITDKMSWLKLLFVWRFGGTLPTLPDIRNQKLLAKMISMAEDSLYATDSMEVARIAEALCKLTGMSQRAASKSGQTFPEEMDDLKETLTGAENPKPNPRVKPEKQPETCDKPKRKSKSDKTPGDSQEKNASDDETDSHSPKNEPNPDNKSGSKSESGSSGAEDKANVTDFDTKDSGEDSADDSESGDSSTNNAGPCEDCDSSNSKQLSSGGAGADSGVGDQADSADDEVTLEDLVGDLQSSISDGLDKATDLEDPDMTKIIKANLPFENDVFDIKPAPYLELWNESIPLVHRIVSELKLPAPRASTAADKYSGRFKTRYYVRNPEAPFSRKKNVGIDVPPMALSLILDRSGSMINMVSSLKLAAIGIARACEELGIPLEVWVLEGECCIKTFDKHWAQTYARIAGIRAAGGTSVIPTLVSAQESLDSRTEPLKQMLMITDGIPDNFETAKELLSSAPFRGLYAMFVVPPLEDPELLQRYTDHGKECLSRLFDPRNFSVAQINKVFGEWSNFMKIYRSRYSTTSR